MHRSVVRLYYECIYKRWCKQVLSIPITSGSMHVEHNTWFVYVMCNDLYRYTTLYTQFSKNIVQFNELITFSLTAIFFIFIFTIQLVVESSPKHFDACVRIDMYESRLIAYKTLSFDKFVKSIEFFEWRLKWLLIKKLRSTNKKLCLRE